MKNSLSTVCLCVVCLMASTSRCQNSCEVAALSEVHAHGADLSLADLLSPGSCPELLQSAARIRLGAPPLAGSVRVFDGNEVRSLVEQTLRNLPPWRRPDTVRVPERIQVRRAGLSSCARIEAKLFAEPAGVSHETDCGAADRITENASLALTRKHWDPALDSWVYSVRCTQRDECVPFLMRVRGLRPGGAADFGLTRKENARATFDSLPSGVAREHDLGLLVQPGQRTSVLWDEDGIRLTVPAICMDKGRAGDTVRVRLERSNRIIRAVVVSPRILRVHS
jgi:Chaperone for flagella basal body P-ring formation